MKQETIKEEREWFTGGEWFCSPVMNFSNTLVSYIRTKDKEIAQLRGCTNGEESEAKANATLISQAKNMYYALKAAQSDYKFDGIISEATAAQIREVLKAANPSLK